jgi:carboxyl-terminal processing protease
LKGNKKLLAGIMLLVFVTVVVSSGLTAVAIYGWNYFKPSFDISFDPQKVSLENIKRFNQVRYILKDTYYQDVDENAMLEGAVSGMVNALKDPYTVYFTKDQMNSFLESTGGSYVGIGVSITVDTNGLLTVIEPFEDSPAKSAGILKDDKIMKVDDLDVTSFRDENMVISKIKGPENTKVKITVYRPSLGKTMDFEMNRKKIKIANIKSEVLPGNIGYIKLIMFDSEIASDFAKHLADLQGKGIKGLIIDVRDNPGGAYDQVINISDRLLPEGLIVYTEDKQKKQDKVFSDKKELGLPLSILINENSASASEILSGAVKDNKKGTLIGTKTFGKGLVQEVKMLEGGAGIKTTISRYFTPSGVCIQGIGILPDFDVKLPEKFKGLPVSQVPRDEDSQLKKAMEVIRDNIK